MSDSRVNRARRVERAVKKALRDGDKLRAAERRNPTPATPASKEN